MGGIQFHLTYALHFDGQSDPITSITSFKPAGSFETIVASSDSSGRISLILADVARKKFNATNSRILKLVTIPGT